MQMHTRHRNLLKNANFLVTKAEPKVVRSSQHWLVICTDFDQYYRPWELSHEEEDRIDDQIRDAQDKIDEELAEWRNTKAARLKDLEATAQGIHNVTQYETQADGL